MLPLGCPVGAGSIHQSHFIFLYSLVMIKKYHQGNISQLFSMLGVIPNQIFITLDYTVWNATGEESSLSFTVFIPNTSAHFSSIAWNKALHLKQSKATKQIAKFICFRGTVLAGLRGWNSWCAIFMILFVQRHALFVCCFLIYFVLSLPQPEHKVRLYWQLA